MSYTKNNIDYFTSGCPRILRVDMGTENSIMLLGDAAAPLLMNL